MSISQTNFLSLPAELHKLIMHNVSDDTSPLRSAMRAVEFGRVCTATHKLTEEDDKIKALFQNETKFDPLVSFLTDRLPSKHFDWRDLDILKILIKEGDLKSSQTSTVSIPGFGPLFLPLVATVSAAFAEEENDSIKLDLCNVYYAIFKRTVEGCLKEKYSKAILKSPARFIDYANRGALLINDELFFNRKVYRDILLSLAGEPLEKITIDKYKKNIDILKTTKLMQGWFNHRLCWCQTICQVHDKIEFDSLKEKYANPGEELLSEMKDKQRGLLNLLLADVNDEIHTLCGDNFNGTIDAAYRTMRDSEEKKDGAKQTYVNAVQAQGRWVTMLRPDVELIANESRVQQIFQDYSDCCVDRESPQRSFAELVARLRELAVWTDGVITSGKKVEIEADLKEDKLHADVIGECTKISQFYTQLSRPINQENEDELFEQMRLIIG